MYQCQNASSYDKSKNTPLKLTDVMEPTHQLTRLAKLIDWTLLSESFAASFKSEKSPSPRMIFGLLYLQAKEDISSEELMERWVKTPEWQYFCGETALKDSYPMHPSVVDIWGREFGVKGSKLMCAALSPSFADIRVH